MTDKAEVFRSYQYQLTIQQMLSTAKSLVANQEIVYRDRMRYDYQTLFKRVNRLANGLDKLGIKQGDTVSFFDYDSHRYLEAYFAVPMTGAVLHSMNWRLSPEQILYVMSHVEADLVFVNADFMQLLEPIKDKLKTVKKYVLLSDDGVMPETTLPIAAEYEGIVQSASSEYEFPELDENSKATTFYTTGTTGLPKGVYFSHRQLVLHSMSVLVMLASYNSIVRFSSSDVYMPMTPMFHVHAWGFPYIATMIGVKQVYPGKYEPEMILKLIRDEGVTFSHCIPTILQMLINSSSSKDTDFSSLKMIVGGARFPRGLAKQAMDMGIEITSGYGMSETCPFLSLANTKPYMAEWDNEKLVDIVTKTGLPVPLCQIKAVDPEGGNTLPRDGESTGELVVRAPWLTQGYFKDEEKSKELWKDGWLHTGDVAHINEEGYIQITDRIKDVIKTGGEWISSLDLENVISMHEAVSEAAAIGIPDEKWGERPILLVTLKPGFKGEGIDGDELREYMKNAASEGKIPKYGIPDRVLIIDEIPKTSVGKLDKNEMRKRYS